MRHRGLLPVLIVVGLLATIVPVAHAAITDRGSSWVVLALEAGLLAAVAVWGWRWRRS